MYENDKFHEECGVFGIWGHGDAAQYTGIGLTALQHRGQESSGVAVSEAGQIRCVCCSGVTTNLMADSAFKALSGRIAIGHVRYSTVGSSQLSNAQPFVMEGPHGQVALCHNGQIVNFEDLKMELGRLGATWLTSSDSEVVLQLCRVSKQPTLMDAIVESLARIRGAFALLILAKDELIVARDPYGFRPLCLGMLGNAVVVCSETCALDAVGARYLREVEPGEIIVINGAGIRTVRKCPSPERAYCVFEHVYFARPDSYVFGDHVGSVRMKIGHNLAAESPAEADIIVPIPESSMWAAIGYQEKTGLPLRMGLVRNSYVGRTFIEPSVPLRESSRRLKLNPVPSVLAGMRVVLIDDSIVRGETIARIVEIVRSAGAREVHLRIGSPPVVASCFYGINTPTKAELIAARYPVEEIQEMVGADSLRYLSLNGLLDAISTNRSHYCTACYTGNYRVRPPGLPQAEEGYVHANDLAVVHVAGAANNSELTQGK
ncbi:MAG TPA: amidophosphoribosyltransferase [Candidatus Saccharimonadales bacterium]|jgi:amidophosphoribosyltransferase|nr:amidophosphoribosyltransferase [Candidatus Saccharimonadales bacterium]